MLSFIHIPYLTDHLLASRLTCQILGLFLMFLFYSGSSFHGGTPVESRLKSCSFFPNSHLVQLLYRTYTRIGE